MGIKRLNYQLTQIIMEKEIKKLTITQATSTSTKKDGTALINKWNKPYVRAGIKCQEYGDQWLNGFLQFAPNDWVGQVKELEVWEEEYQGNKSLKFGLPRKFAVTKEMWDELVRRINVLETFSMDKQLEPTEGFDNMPNELEDTPF